MKDFIDRFLKAFDGYEFAFGQHGNFKAKENGKMEGKAQTILGSVTRDVVLAHLNGDGAGLGIVPLKNDDTCSFGAIDLDIVGVNPLTHSIQEIENKVTGLGLPLVACSTKSGGIHLYCFTKKPISSEIMVNRLKEWSALLGYGNHEIFPKQTYRINENDIGNWINLPYYNCNETKRFCVNKGKQIDIEKFFELIEVIRISENEMKHFKIPEMDNGLEDAPPCLQVLKTVGMEEGSRNNGIYNFAVYFKKRSEDTWQDDTREINSKHVSPALSDNEVSTIINSVNKKDFFYKCKEYPICQYCNKGECRKRKYGIGADEDDILQLENLTKYIMSEEETIWFAEYQGKRIQLTTEELLNQNKLQKKVVEAINKTFPPMKNSKWMENLNSLLKSCTIVHEPVQASRKGQFFELLDSFLTEGVTGEEKDDLLKYNTYTDTESGIIYFRSFNLFSYMKNKRFKCSEQEVWLWLKDKNAQSKKMRIAKKSLNVWSIPAPEYFQFDEGDKDESKL